MSDKADWDHWLRKEAMSEAEYIQGLSEQALDALYDSLSVQTMPEGRYDGRAWIYGHPVLGWVASLVWKGKVFQTWKIYSTDEPFDRNDDVRNLVLGLLLFFGDAWCTRAIDGRYEIKIDYPRLGLRDTLRQVSPTLYLGRMQWRRWTVHFTLSKER